LLKVSFDQIDFGERAERVSEDVMSEAFAEGYNYLLSAAKRFDPWKNDPQREGNPGRFSTYAVLCTMGGMIRSLHQHDMIRIPAAAAKDLKNYYKAYDYYIKERHIDIAHDDLILASIYYKERGYMPSSEELDQFVYENRVHRNIGKTLDRISRLIDSKKMDSIDESRWVQNKKPVTDETVNHFLADSLVDLISDPQANLMESVEHELMKQELRAALDRMPPRERSVLELRYGLKGGVEHTMEEIGKKLGVTRERIRQLEAQALSRLRHPSTRRKLRDYLGE
jgi:RNA polymerase sigma factor (sigma-70 family)